MELPKELTPVLATALRLLRLLCTVQGGAQSGKHLHSPSGESPRAVDGRRRGDNLCEILDLTGNHFWRRTLAVKQQAGAELAEGIFASGLWSEQNGVSTLSLHVLRAQVRYTVRGAPFCWSPGLKNL